MNTPDQHHFTTDSDTSALPAVVDRAAWQAERDKLLDRAVKRAHNLTDVENGPAIGQLVEAHRLVVRTRAHCSVQ